MIAVMRDQFTSWCSRLYVLGVGIILAATTIVWTAPSSSGSGAPFTNLKGNWTGYVKNLPDVDPHRGIYWVHAEWHVPALRCAGVLGDNTAIGIWAGLGGAGRSVLPFYQTGIAARCVQNSPDYYAWYETFAGPKVIPGDPDQAPKRYPGDTSEHPLPLQAGDHVVADVINSFGRYTVSLRNRTQRWDRHRVFDSCDDTPGGVGGLCFRFRGTSIEVVTENPGAKAYPTFEPVKFFGVAAATQATRFRLPPGIRWLRLAVPRPFGEFSPEAITQDNVFPESGRTTSRWTSADHGGFSAGGGRHLLGFSKLSITCCT